MVTSSRHIGCVIDEEFLIPVLQAPNKGRSQIAIAPRGSGVPGMSAPGAGGERLLFPICDSAPRGTGDPSKSALGAGRMGIQPTTGYSAHQSGR
jgi:hypothetical protein